jgi:ABC-2 type transport system ATP-binding protein
MDEAAELADRVGIMDHGKLLALDTPAALMRSVPGGTTLELTTHAPDEPAAAATAAALGALREVERVERLGPGGGEGLAASPRAGAGPVELRMRLYVSGDAPNLVAPVAALLAGQGLALEDVKLGIPTLEDVFINFTGRALR